MTVVHDWRDNGSNPLADIAAWKDFIAHRCDFGPNQIWLSRKVALRFTYTMRRLDIGKPLSKRSWRRHRGRWQWL